MKIVHWDEMFHPNFGYQINVLPVYQQRQGNEVTIITAEHPERHPTFASFANGNDDILALDKKFCEETGIKIIRLPILGVYSGRVIYKPGFLKAINDEHPDVILCHTSDTLSAMQIIKRHKHINAPIVFDNHMLEIASGNRLRNLFRAYYRKRITPIITKNRFVTIRTQDDDYVMKCLGIPKELAPYISFGTDTDLFKPNEVLKKQYRSQYGIPEDAFVIVYAGKIDNAKNGLLLAKAVEKKFNTDKSVYIIVISNSNHDDYSESVESIFGKSENEIIRLKTQPYRSLSKYYMMADMSVFAKQCSLSFFDVQSAGLPVVLENNSVNVERVSYGNGFTFRSGDLDDFISKIEKCINMPKDDFDRMKMLSRKSILQRFDYNVIAKQYTDLLISEMNRQNFNQ